MTEKYNIAIEICDECHGLIDWKVAYEHPLIKQFLRGKVFTGEELVESGNEIWEKQNEVGRKIMDAFGVGCLCEEISEELKKLGVDESTAYVAERKGWSINGMKAMSFGSLLETLSVESAKQLMECLGTWTNERVDTTTVG